MGAKTFKDHISEHRNGLQWAVDGWRLNFLSTGTSGGSDDSKAVIELAAVQERSHMEGFALLSVCIDKHRVSVRYLQRPEVEGGGQKKASYFQELELHTVMSCHVGTKNHIRVLHKCSKPLSHLARPFYYQLHFMNIYP